MKLIVGLGNPGREYKHTRHNIGFMILDNYLGKVSWKNKMDAYTYKKEINNKEVMFMKPLTYMNLSGLAVNRLVNFYKIAIKDILVIQDDIDLQLGTYKVKSNSSSGGHNGIKSIIKELNSNEFTRLKIGIGRSELIPAESYVLTKFSDEDTEKIKNNYIKFNEIIDTFIKN